MVEAVRLAALLQAHLMNELRRFLMNLLNVVRKVEVRLGTSTYSILATVTTYRYT